MTGIEDRLAQALRARTDLVTADRLTPAEPPVAARAGTPWRRPAAYALVAAACAAAIVLPFALMGGDREEPGPVEPPTPSAPMPSATQSPQPTRSSTPSRTPTVPRVADGLQAGHSPFNDRSNDIIGLDDEFGIDLDGGGTDTVRLHTPGDVARLTVTFDDGTEVRTDLEPPRAAIDAGSLQPVVHTVPLGGEHPLLVVRWGGLDGVVRIFDPLDGLRLVPFTSTFGSDNRSEDGARVNSVLTTAGSFYAFRFGEEYVDVYRWEVQYDGGKAVYLVLGNNGRPLGRWCADGPEGAGWVTCT